MAFVSWSRRCLPSSLSFPGSREGCGINFICDAVRIISALVGAGFPSIPFVVRTTTSGTRLIDILLSSKGRKKESTLLKGAVMWNGGRAGGGGGLGGGGGGGVRVCICVICRRFSIVNLYGTLSKT